MLLFVLSWLLCLCGCSAVNCREQSITTVSGTHAPKARICPGDLIFEDNFSDFKLSVWDHEITLSGGGNWEFQAYINNRSNSYTENGILHIKPTLLSDDFGEGFLQSGTIDLHGNHPVSECTDARWYGCSRTGNNVHILNPIKSAKIRTVHSFSFRYGRIEVRAKLPRGDWLWPAIYLMPRYNQYSSWPLSGEIDLIESRGNLNLLDKNGNNIGTKQVSHTLHWGPNPEYDLYKLTHFESNNSAGFDDDFHLYQMQWNEDGITFFIDYLKIGSVAAPKGGFWELGRLDQTQFNNPWKGASKIAPFDQEFYIIINLACGGINFFPDDATNPGGKPWKNNSPNAAKDFWNGRNQWLPTWKTGENILKVDYVKVWAI